VLFLPLETQQQNNRLKDKEIVFLIRKNERRNVNLDYGYESDNFDKSCDANDLL
jgi:hypothetical protein